jgi:hypothetical protein
VEFFAVITLMGPGPAGGVLTTTFKQTINVAPGEQTANVFDRVLRAAMERFGSYLAGHDVLNFTLIPAVLVPVTSGKDSL